MTLSIIKAALSLLLVPVALGLPDANLPCLQQKNAMYDDVAWTEGGPSPVPSPYLGLDYTTVQVGQYPFSAMIKPESGNQYAISYGGSGNISAQSNAIFAPQSFWFACDSGIPQPECVVHLWGLRNGNVVARKRLTFPALPSGLPDNSFVMNYTTFGNEWSFINSLGFSINKAGGGDFFGALLIDNFKYNGQCG